MCNQWCENVCTGLYDCRWSVISRRWFARHGILSCNTSSTVGGFRILKNSPVYFGSAYRASVCPPRVDIRETMFAVMFWIWVMKKSARVSQRSLLSTGVNISGACIKCSRLRITDHFRRGLVSAAWKRSHTAGDGISWLLRLLFDKQLDALFDRLLHDGSSISVRVVFYPALASTASLDSQCLSRLKGENLMHVWRGQWWSRTAVVMESSCFANCTIDPIQICFSSSLSASNKSISSANFGLLILWPCTETPVPISFIGSITLSRYEIIVVGDIRSPCLVPTMVLNQSPSSPPTRIADCDLWLLFCRLSINLVPLPYDLTVAQITSCFIKSNAFWKSIDVYCLW